MTRASLVLLLLVCAISLAGCDWGKGHSEAEFKDGVVEVDHAVQPAGLLDGVLGIRRGTPASVVRAKLGAPFAKVGAKGESCWVYHAHQSGSSLSALDFCMNKQQRVGHILLGVHG